MNKAIKDAISKGKELKAKLDEKKELEAQQRAKQKKIAELKKKAALEVEAERLMSRIPELITETISKGESHFTLFGRNIDYEKEYNALCAIIEPKLKKLGLKSGHTSSTHWVYTSFDPDQGYDATSLYLEVMVPEDK